MLNLNDKLENLRKGNFIHIEQQVKINFRHVYKIFII